MKLIINCSIATISLLNGRTCPTRRISITGTCNKSTSLPGPSWFIKVLPLTFQHRVIFAAQILTLFAAFFWQLYCEVIQKYRMWFESCSPLNASSLSHQLWLQLWVCVSLVNLKFGIMSPYLLQICSSLVKTDGEWLWAAPESGEASRVFSGGRTGASAGLFEDYLILAHAFVTSCLDDCDALSTCITQSSLNHPQFVWNSAARLRAESPYLDSYLSC